MLYATAESIETTVFPIEEVDHDQPRISLNRLAMFPFANEKGKLEILRNQKFGQKIKTSYYNPALRGILQSFQNGAFVPELLEAESRTISRTRSRPFAHVHKHNNNFQAILNLIEMGEAANPPPGTHRVIDQNARVFLEGVVINARPEIITENNDEGYFAFTKLRFSKDKFSVDTQELVLLVLLHYGQQQSHPEMRFSIEKSKLVDCLSKTVTFGHEIDRCRHQQLQRTLSEVRELWPAIQR
jgi:hypothetical protein